MKQIDLISKIKKANIKIYKILYMNLYIHIFKKHVYKIYILNIQINLLTSIFVK
jgi:hypothetical protein